MWRRETAQGKGERTLPSCQIESRVCIGVNKAQASGTTLYQIRSAFPGPRGFKVTLIRGDCDAELWNVTQSPWRQAKGHLMSRQMSGQQSCYEAKDFWHKESKLFASSVWLKKKIICHHFQGLNCLFLQQTNPKTAAAFLYYNYFCQLLFRRLRLSMVQKKRRLWRVAHLTDGKDLAKAIVAAHDLRRCRVLHL